MDDDTSDTANNRCKPWSSCADTIISRSRTSRLVDPDVHCPAAGAVIVVHRTTFRRRRDCCRSSATSNDCVAPVPIGRARRSDDGGHSRRTVRARHTAVCKCL